MSVPCASADKRILWGCCTFSTTRTRIFKDWRFLPDIVWPCCLQRWSIVIICGHQIKFTKEGRISPLSVCFLCTVIKVYCCLLPVLSKDWKEVLLPSCLWKPDPAAFLEACHIFLNSDKSPRPTSLVWTHAHACTHATERTVDTTLLFSEGTPSAPSYKMSDGWKMWNGYSLCGSWNQTIGPSS